MGRTLPGCIAAFAAVASALRVATPSAPHGRRCASPSCVASLEAPVADKISAEAPLHVLIAGAGVGGLALANQLELSNSNVKYTVLECARAAPACAACTPHCLLPFRCGVQLSRRCGVRRR